MIRNIFKVAVRNFFHNPGLSTLNVFGLSVGFTCAFLTLLWVANEFSFDRFHSQSERIFKVISHVESNGSFQTFGVAAANIDISSIPEIEGRVTIANGSRWPFELCFRPEDKPEECLYLNGIYSNESLFSLFQFPLLQGDPNPLGQPTNIAVSERMAEKLFGKNPAIGKIIKIDGRYETKVASIFKNVPANSTIQFDFALPLDHLKKMWGVDDERLGNNFFETYVRTNSDITPSSLTAKLNDNRVLPEKLKADKVSYEAFPFNDWRLHSKFEGGKNSGGRIEYVTIFVIIAIMVVLMAIINFINMSTARATTRAREIGIRKVTGAARSGILVQFLTESFLVVSLAFLVAVGISQLALPFFSEVLSEPMTLRLYSGWIPAFLFLFLIMVSVLAGIYPAFVMSGFQPIKVLKNSMNGQSGSQGIRKTLLILQLGVSTAIIIFAGVLYFQLNFITNKNLGFDRGNMIHVEPTFRLFQKFESFKNELLKNPEILGVATSAANPLHLQAQNTGVKWPGKPKDARITFQTFACSYEFPETLGLKILEGRSFLSQPQDSTRTEILLSENAVKTMELTNPLGETIQIGDANCVVVGVTSDFHTESLHETMLPVIIFRAPYEHTSGIYMKYQPGTTQKAMQILNDVYRKFEPSFTMKYWFQDETFDSLYKTEIVASRLVLLFAIIALVMAIIGVVGLATFNVLRKVKEIGIRRVFGATMTNVLMVLSKEFAIVMIAALAIALPAAWYAADLWLQGFAYHVGMPWWLYGITGAGIAIFTLCVICVQGLKTIATNPTEVLRSE